MTEKKESFFSKVFGGGCGCCNVEIEEVPEEGEEAKTTIQEAKKEK
ncbi:hypothetical protein MASR2M79_07590 [Aminivibrio sp.]